MPIRSSADSAGLLAVRRAASSAGKRAIRDMLGFAGHQMPLGIRPVYQGQEGRLAWLSAVLVQELLKAASTTRMDELLQGRLYPLDVDDPAVLSNVNTREDWDRARAQLQS